MSKLAKILVSLSIVAVAVSLAGAALYFWKNSLRLADDYVDEIDSI